jgi:hypothetical protein
MSEREAFEAAQRPRTDLNKSRDGRYKNPVVQSCWEAWQARASLDASAGQADEADEMRGAAMRTVQAMGLVYTKGADRWKPQVAAPTPAAAQDAQAKDDRYTEGYDDGMANARELLADMRVKADDHRRLVRELDVLLNGEEGAAKQASLCDVVAQVRREGIRSVQYKGTVAQYERGAFAYPTIEHWLTEIAGDGEIGHVISEMTHIEAARQAFAAARAAASPVSGAARDVLAERARQVSVEGWTAAHDDGANDVAALADAAVCYAMHAAQTLAGAYIAPNTTPNKTWWPWDASWWKPTTPRRDLVKAGALIIAEIERIDRAEKRCRACNGNDGDIPCAYPEGHPNCLRVERAGGKS